MAGLDGCIEKRKSLAPTGVRTPSLLARSELLYRLLHLGPPVTDVKVKQSSPVTGLEWPRGFQKLRFPDFMTKAQEGPYAPAALPPGNPPGTHFC